MTPLLRIAGWVALSLAIPIIGAIFAPGAGQAQGEDNDHVDVALILEVPDHDATPGGQLDIIVVNHGSRTAYDVEVVVSIVYPEDSSYFPAPGGYYGRNLEVPVGTVSQGEDIYSLKWSIPALGGLQRETIKVLVYQNTVRTDPVQFDKTLYSHEYFGKVTTSSFESSPHKENNEARVWSYRYRLDHHYQRQAAGNYSLTASVDEQSPAPGDTVNFTITTTRENPFERYLKPPPIDLEVAIELTGGLSVTGTPTYRCANLDTCIVPDQVTYSDGVFNVGTPKQSGSPTYSVTLPVTVGSDASARNQCLTATLTGNPPPGVGRYDDDISDNEAKVCLGTAPAGERVLFTTGQTDLFTWYDCSEETSGPCESNVSLEMVALGGTAAEAGVFQPDDVVVHIPDPAGRATSSDANSDSLVWSTGFQHPGRESDRRGTIVVTNAARLDIETTDDNDQWGRPHDVSGTIYQVGDLKAEVAGPGEVSTWYHGTNNVPTASFGSGTNKVIYDDLWYVGYSWIRYNIWLEFSSLGTYTVKQTIKAKYDDDTTDTTDPVEYTDTETYTFHVGPMVELEVRDGGARPDIGADQYAITIAALNNGPDDATVDAEVTVNLSLPTGVTLAKHIASDGAYSAGTWDLGALKTTDHRRNAGKREEATLTLILDGADAATATATATIANVQDDYEVCISSGIYERLTLSPTNQTDCKSHAGTTNVWYAEVCVNTAAGEIDSSITVEATCDGTTDRAWTEDVCASSDDSIRANRTEEECDGWFQGTVYEYNSDNDTATITARAGTGGVGEGIPTLQTPTVHAPAVGIAWSEVEFLYGLPAKDYQIQWSIDGVSDWTQLQTELSIPELFDITIQTGQTRYYRVRAVNEAGVPGPWSAPMAAMPIDTNEPGVSISETELTITEGESAEYTVTLQGRPHSNVTVRINGGGVVSPNPSALTFTMNDFNVPQTVELTGIQDNDPDNEQFDVTHTISSSDAGYRSLRPDPVAVTVIDDDSGVSVAAHRESVNEGEDITFTLTRTGNTSAAISVDLGVSQRGSFLPAEQLGSRSVSIGANVATETVTVQTENDTVREGAGSVTPTVNTGTGYLVGTPRSATVSVQDDDGPPGQPGDLDAQERDREIRLTWSSAPTGDEPVLGYSYRVRRSDRSAWAPDWTELTGGDARNSHTVSDLTNGQEYIFQVRARNATGHGAVAEVRANPKAPPGRPAVTVKSRHESLLVSWNVEHDGGRDITQYQVQWKSGNQTFDSSRQDTPTAREYTISNLENDTPYQVRVRAKNEVDWGHWSVEHSGTPTPRPATTLLITTDAQNEDKVSEPVRLQFTFTDQDHDGANTEHGVEGFGVDDIEVWYRGAPDYELNLKDFRVEVKGFRYSARLDDILDGTLNITVAAGAARSTYDGQRSTGAAHSIKVKVPTPEAPTGTQIWSAEMTVGKHEENARGYIDFDRSVWSGTGKIGSLSDNDSDTDDDSTFTYAGKQHTVGEISYVPAWTEIFFILCPGLEGADRTFDLYLDDLVDGQADLTLSFDADEVQINPFDRTIDGVEQSCVEYRWRPNQVDWQDRGKVQVSLVK